MSQPSFLVTATDGFGSGDGKVGVCNVKRPFNLTVPELSSENGCNTKRPSYLTDGCDIHPTKWNQLV